MYSYNARVRKVKTHLFVSFTIGCLCEKTRAFFAFAWYVKASAEHGYKIEMKPEKERKTKRK